MVQRDNRLSSKKSYKYDLESSEVVNRRSSLGVRAYSSVSNLRIFTAETRRFAQDCDVTPSPSHPANRMPASTSGKFKSCPHSRLINKLYHNTLNPIYRTESNRLQAHIKKEFKKHSQQERPLPIAYSGTANREVAHLGLSTNRIARYPHMALNLHHRLCSPDDYVISCLLPATPSILL
ncbi:hypothetical protein TNIN_186691 [Trichonephila inaurata madagascariensis]|uniref:Uncharacterized protein n=1 Tax=Trichonephila inaurata madagascariensis TaxID=2747483 RepID=A0A8X6WXI6_9ARAC|nr:hypothetical protein TNIN_186691 [Trichonephila inaurata madagascariensis]